MNPDVKFILAINSEDQASVSAAIQIWKTPSIQTKVLKFVEENAKYERNRYQLEDRWNEINAVALKEFSKTKSSEETSRAVNSKIETLGKKILYWVRLTIESSEPFELDLVKKLQWTVYGTIDESKTFEVTWRKNYYDPESVYPYACLFVQKDFIKNHLKDMILWIQCLFTPFKLKDSEYNVYTIVTMYICYCYGMNNIGGSKLYKNLRKLKSPASELFRICLTLTYVKAAKYFYRKLKKEEQQKILIEAGKDCFALQKIYSDEIRREKLAELVIFLINNMAHADKISFVTKNLIDILDLIIFLWPYQNLFVPILDFIWPNLSEEDQEKVLDLILVSLMTDSSKNIYVNKKVHQGILKKILEKIPYDLAYKKICVEKYWYKLFKQCDFATLCIIISHSKLYQVRNTLIEMCREDLKRLIADGKFEVVDLYLSILLLSDAEKNNFKRNLNLLPDFVTKGQFDLADKFIDWRCGSEEEKAIVKKDINPRLILSKFTIQEKNDLANSFLNWYFNFSKVTDDLKEEWYKSLCNTVFTIWGKTCVCGSEFAESKCVEFLKTFYKSDEGIQWFKKEAFGNNEDIVKMFCDHLEFVEGFNTINDLLNFFLIEPQKIKEIKLKIVKNFDWWIDLYGIKKNNFLVVDALINWAAKDDIQKNFFIGNFLNSKNGPLLCVTVLNACKYDKEVPAALKLFNEWIKPAGNVNKIKEKLKGVKNGGVQYTENNISQVISMLDKLEL